MAALPCVSSMALQAGAGHGEFGPEESHWEKRDLESHRDPELQERFSYSSSSYPLSFKLLEAHI